MDKIEKKWPDNTELRNKVNELVEGYNRLVKDVEALHIRLIHHTSGMLCDDVKSK